MISLSFTWMQQKIAATIYLPTNCNVDTNRLICTSVSIDSRNIQENAVFIAIKGRNFDGHDFLASAINKGASLAIVETAVADVKIPQLVVADCQQALGIIAKEYRKLYHGIVIAITGSNGKTSTKNMLATICKEQGKTAATQGNYNNQLGLPLSLLNMSLDNEFIILEVATNMPGEIAILTDICRPNIAVITNAGRSHLELLHTVAKVATEKSSIISNAQAGATVILNKDDEFYNYWQAIATASNASKVISFSTEQATDVVSTDYTENDQGMNFTLLLQQQKIVAFMQAWGKHQLTNCCCAAATALAADVSHKNIVAGIAKISLAAGRGKRYRLANGALIIDESYNANPDSVIAAIRQLSSYRDCYTIMVLGDMLELGDKSIEYHEHIGKIANKQGINELVTIGNLAEFANKKFGGKHFSKLNYLIDFLQAKISDNTVLLIKGSNKMGLLKVVDALTLKNSKGDIKCYYG